MNARESRPRAAAVGPLAVRSWRAAVATLVLLALSPGLHAAEPVGRVIALDGTVRVLDEEGDPARTLAFEDAVYPGETLATGENGRLQIRFRDGALVALVPESRFEIERYGEAEDAGGSVLMHLIKGALRTITGTIGQQAEDQYELKTPVATIGIRGTEYAVDFCAANCAGPERRPGLYGRVNNGAITVSTEVDSGAFGIGEYFYIAGAQSIPQPVTTPPKGLRFNIARDAPTNADQDQRESAPAQRGRAQLPDPAAPQARGRGPGGASDASRPGGGQPDGSAQPGGGAGSSHRGPPADVGPPGASRGQQNRP